MTDKITIETDNPISISTTSPVSITTEGGTTTLKIGSVREPSGLVDLPRAPRAPEAMLPKTDKPRHGKIMARSGEPCARVEGHNGVCMTAEQIKRKQDYNKAKARERYAEDPEYAERVKAQSRASFQKRQGGEE